VVKLLITRGNFRTFWKLQILLGFKDWYIEANCIIFFCVSHLHLPVWLPEGGTCSKQLD